MEINEAELIERELTVRSLRLNKEALETRRSAIRWLALSLGMINPGESRHGVLSVLDALVYFQFVKKTDPTVKDMIGYINENWDAINEKTMRYHLLRMKKMGFIENAQGKFLFKPPAVGDRFDAHDWAYGLFASFYKDVSEKVGGVVNGIKEKGASV